MLEDADSFSYNNLSGEFDGKTDITSDKNKKSRFEFEKIYSEYSDELVAGLRAKYGNGPPDPQDIAHDAFQRVFESKNLNHISNVKAFLWRTARNLMITDRRTQTVRTKYELEVERIYFSLKGENLSPEHAIEARKQLLRLNELIQTMPEKRRLALLLSRVEGLTLAQIGQQLNISKTAVVKHIGRAQTQIYHQFVEGRND